MDPILLQKAKFCQIVEQFHPDDDRRKLAAVSQALLDLIDYCLDNKIMTALKEKEIKLILARTFLYLGDDSLE